MSAPLHNLNLDWDVFRTFIDGTREKLAYFTQEKPSAYEVWTELWGGISFYCAISRQNPPSGDQLDFETNFKNKPTQRIVQRADDGLQRLAIERPDMEKRNIVSYDWCDKTTWYQSAERVVDRQAADTGDHQNFSTGDTFLIDASHGKIFQEDFLKSPDGYSYLPQATLNGVPIVEIDPDTGVGDYTINYATGIVTLAAPITPPCVLLITYFKAVNSTFIVAPNAGESLLINVVEIQFTDDISLTDTAVFQFYGPTDIFAPSEPPGNMVAIGKALHYKSLRDYYAESNKAYPVMPALSGQTWRGLNRSVLVMNWDYESKTKISSQYGMQLRLSLKRDRPFGGSMATVTFYCLVEKY